MSEEYKAQIFDLLLKFALMFEAQPTKERIEAYTQQLAQYPVHILNKAFSQLSTRCHRFPSLAQIIDLIDPAVTNENKANELAGEIINCISAYGYPNAESVKKAVGKVGWFVIERAGGWPNICQIATNDLNTLRAQLRDLAKSALLIEQKDEKLLGMEYQERQDKALKPLAYDLKQITGENNVN